MNLIVSKYCHKKKITMSMPNKIVFVFIESFNSLKKTHDPTFRMIYLD